MPESAQRFRTTRQGVPIATTPSGMSRVTTLPAPMMESSPTETPGNTIAAAPIQTFDPIENGTGELQEIAPNVGVSRVVGREELHTGRDLRAVADHHRGAIQDHRVEVDERVVADQHVVAVVAGERGLHRRPPADPAQEIPQDSQALLLIRLGIEGLQQRPAPLALADELWVGGSIELA